MVLLDKIYTKTGDGGQTTLSDGSRVEKFSLRVEAFGTVDEANAHIGLARHVIDAKTDAMLSRIQNDMFDLGADLARPIKSPPAESELRITQQQINRLEEEIDQINGPLGPLKSFVLPGGTINSCHLHVARTVTRRAERLVTELFFKENEQKSVNPLAAIYLNRLSDHLFVLARRMNENGELDILWEPGKNQ